MSISRLDFSHLPRTRSETRDGLTPRSLAAFAGGSTKEHFVGEAGPRGVFLPECWLFVQHTGSAKHPYRRGRPRWALDAVRPQEAGLPGRKGAERDMSTEPQPKEVLTPGRQEEYLPDFVTFVVSCSVSGTNKANFGTPAGTRGPIMQNKRNSGSSGFSVLGGLGPKRHGSTPKREESEKRRFRGVDATPCPPPVQHPNPVASPCDVLRRRLRGRTLWQTAPRRIPTEPIRWRASPSCLRPPPLVPGLFWFRARVILLPDGPTCPMQRLLGAVRSHHCRTVNRLFSFLLAGSVLRCCGPSTEEPDEPYVTLFATEVYHHKPR